MKLEKTKFKNRRLLSFEPYEPKGLICLGHYRYLTMDNPLWDHAHQNIMEICYLESGYQTYVVDQEEFHLQGGDAFLTFPNEKHGTGNFVEEKGSLYWFQIKTLHMDSFLDLPKKESDYLIKSLNNLPSRHFKANSHWKELYENIFSLSEETDLAYRNLKLRQWTMSLLLDCIELSNQHFDKKIDTNIDKALAFIQENIESVFSIKDVANICFLSESHFKSKFKSTTGLSPLDYIQRKKIERAKELIHSGQLSMTEIAMRLGFSSSQYFSSVFKKYTGKKPSQFE